MRLSSSIKRAGHNVALSELSIKKLKKDIESFKPDVLAYSIMSCNSDIAFRINSTLKKEHDFLSVFGGPHATYFPETIEVDGVDAICRGEGESAFVNFLNRMEKGNAYHETPNFWVKRDGEITKNEVRPLTKDLDSIPTADHALFYERFWDAKNNPVKSFHTSRGCPYKCAYCYVASYRELNKGNENIGAFRVRSVENLISEIEKVKNRYPIKFIRFYSDLFFVKIKWLEEFREEYSKRIGLPFWCMITPTYINDRVITALKKAGCWSVAMGVEAGDEDVRRNILKRPVGNDHIHNALKLVTEGGFRAVTFNILGIPGGSFECDMKLLDLNMPYKVSYAMASIMTPFPKTGIYYEALKRGLIDESKFIYDNTIFKKSVLNIPDKKKVERLQKLVGLVVSYKWLKPLLGVLIKLPLGSLYWLLYKLHMSYAYRFKVFPAKAPLRFNLISFIRFFWGLKSDLDKPLKKIS